MPNPYDALAASLQPQDQSADANPYDALLADVAAQEQQRARTVYEKSLATNPDQAAESVRLAKQTGLPADTVERNLDEVRRREQARALDLQRLAAESPILARQLADPTFTKQAHDDLGVLEQVGQFFKNTGQATKAGVFNTSRGAAGVFQAGAEFVAPALDFLENPEISDNRAGAVPFLFDMPGGNPLRRLAEGFAAVGGDAGKTAKAAMPRAEGNIAAGYYSGIQSLTQNLLAMPMAFAPGGQGAALGMMTATTGGQSYQDAREQGLSMSQALPFAASQAAIEYATERMPLGALVGDVKAGTAIFKTLAKQLALEIPGEQIATVLQDMNEWAVLPENKDKPFRDYIAERPDAAAQTLVATIVGTGGNVVVAKGIESAARRLAGDAYEAGVAEQSADQLQAAMQTAAQSMLRQRNPEEFRALMQRMAENTEGAPQEVYLDAEVLNQLPQDVLQALPENVLGQLAEALAANGTVAIPVADVLTIAPGTPLEQAVVENARVGDPMAMTQAEAAQAGEQAQQYLAQEAERVIAQAQDAAVMQASSDRVRQNLLDQLNTAGRFNPSVNDAYATWTTAFYTTMAGRMGVTPEELLQRFPLRIGAQAEQAEHGGGLEQSAQTDTPEFRNWFGDSKVVDESGKPLVVNHATWADFDTFDFGRLGETTDSNASDEGLAQTARVGTWFSSRNLAEDIGATRNVETYLAISNPKKYRTLGALARAAKKAGGGAALRAALSDQGFDGVALADEEFGGTSYVAFHPEQIKSATGNRGTFDPNDPNILNQSDARDLVLTHNLTADNLLHAVKMGGIAVPSLAVTKKDNPLAGFGEITLIGPKEMADPKGYADTKVFGADIYSPRYPSITYAFTASMKKRGEGMLKDGVAATESSIDWEEVGRDGPRELERSPAVMWKFLTERGIEPAIVRTEPKPLPSALQPFAESKLDAFDLKSSPEFIDAAWQAHAELLVQEHEGDRAAAEAEIAKDRAKGERVADYMVRSYANQVEQFRRDQRDAGKVDRRATKYALEEQVRKADLQGELETYARDFLRDINPDEKIFQGYTNSGNRKYIPHTLENVVKILKKELRGGESFNYGVGSLRAKFTPQFKSVEQIRKAKGRLVSKAEFEKVKAEIDTQFEEALRAISPDLSSTTGIAIMEDAAKMGVQRAAKSYGFDVSDEAAVKVAEFLTRLRGLPTEYFEAKILREVDLAEFAGAVVPEGVAPKVVEALQARGVKDIRTYKKGDEADRAAKIGEFENLFFQGPRGTFNPATLQLVLNENADLSTFLHETGHFFLEVMADLASQPNAPAEIQDDMGALLKWFGIKGDENVGGLDAGGELAQGGERAVALSAWFGEESNLRNPDGTPRVLYHGTTARNEKAIRKGGEFKRSKTGAMGGAIYLGDSAEASAGYADGAMMTVYARGRYMGNRKWSEYVAKHGWSGAEAAARADGWAGVYDEKFESAVAVWDSSNIKATDAKEFTETGGILAQDGNLPTDDTQPVRRTPLETWNAMTLDQKRQYHERFAESFEQYLIEGRAPSLELQPLFRKFKRWMEKVYTDLKTFIAGHPDSGIVLSDEIRQVFDRMLATREQIAQAEEVAGMVPDETATEEAVERLTARSLRDLKWTVNARAREIKKLQKQAAALRKGVEAEVRAEVEAMPVYRAMQFMRTDTKIAIADLENLYMGEGDRYALLDWKPLTDKRLAGKEGVHPDILADMFGFESGDALVRAILDAEPISATVEGLTDQRMLEEHGDLVDQRAIEEAANEAVHNEARARSLATELKAQADMLGVRRDTGETNAKGSKVTVSVIAEAAKQFAANVVARTPVRDLKARAWQHVAAERRAGKRWQEATAKGQTQDAVKAKQDQVLNNAAAKAATEAQAEVRKITDFFARVVKGNSESVVEKGRDPDVVNAARAILAAYGMAPRAGKTALEYLEVLQRNDPAMFAALQPSIQGALTMARPLDTLTLDELRSLHDEIQAMWHLAKRSRQMEVDGNLLDVEDAEADLQARMQEIGVPDEVPGEKGAITPREAAQRKLQYARSLLRRVEQWAEGMDGKFGGPFLRLVFQPVKDAADRYRADRVKYRKAYQALVDQVAPHLRKGEIAAPELGYTFGRGHNGIGHAELLHAILHTGNESNKRKLLLGRKWATENPDGTLDTRRWDAFIARMHADGTLGKAHYDFAQGVWDLLEQTKPLAQKTHRDVFGRYFAEVTANEVATPFGTYRGGYVPAQADPQLVQDAEIRKLAETENESMAYAFPSTNRGFTKGRVEYNRPLVLDLRSIGQHLDKVLLFSHMEAHVRDVQKLLSRKAVSYSLGRIDPTAYAGMLTPWLSRSARQVVETPVTGDGGLNRILTAARNRAGMALMFANVSNTLQQITGFSLAAVKVKPGLMMKATAQFIAHPKQTAKAVAEASPFMANRMENEVSAINDAIDQILLDPSIYERAQSWTQKHAYFLQTAMANTMEPIIWTAAYNQAVEQGEHDAVRFADSVIRTTQGSTLPEDVSRIETGPAYARAFTQFIGYFNMMANTNGTALQQIASELGIRKGAGKMLYVVTLGLLAPLWVAEAIAIAMRGGPDDEDDDGYLDDWLAAVFGMGTIKGTLAMIPFVGQLGNAAINRMNNNPADDRVSLSPAVSLLEAAAGVPSDVYKLITDPEKLNARNAVRDVASLISITTGLPAYAVARPAGYLAGVADGRIDPTSAGDLARGAVTGVPSPESR